jgi:tripeptidyl-peptidase I
VASGDSGVAGNPGDGNTNGCLKDGTVFSPEFPSACPYVTSVGATLLTGNAKADEETAVTRFASGGGFSNVFYPPPDYQTSAVSTYLQSAGTPYPYYIDGDYNSSTAGLYNRNGRGYPDVSAIGDNILFFSKGIPKRQGGSSASAPVFASILTRINNERLKAGKSTVGFVNPTLYKYPYVLHDITVGSNPGCDTDGFTVSKGWDPVTGLGTPNYPAMLELFMSL